MSVFLFGISSFCGWSPRLSYTGIEVQQPNAFFLTTLINMPNQNKSIHPSTVSAFPFKNCHLSMGHIRFLSIQMQSFVPQGKHPFTHPIPVLFPFSLILISSPCLLFPSLCPCGKINLLCAENLALVFYVIQVLSTGNDYVILHSLFLPLLMYFVLFYPACLDFKWMLSTECWWSSKFLL